MDAAAAAIGTNVTLGDGDDVIVGGLLGTFTAGVGADRFVVEDPSLLGATSESNLLLMYGGSFTGGAGTNTFYLVGHTFGHVAIAEPSTNLDTLDLSNIQVSGPVARSEHVGRATGREPALADTAGSRRLSDRDRQRLGHRSQGGRPERDAGGRRPARRSQPRTPPPGKRPLRSSSSILTRTRRGRSTFTRAPSGRPSSPRWKRTTQPSRSSRSHSRHRAAGLSRRCTSTRLRPAARRAAWPTRLTWAI